MALSKMFLTTQFFWGRDMEQACEILMKLEVVVRHVYRHLENVRKAKRNLALEVDFESLQSLGTLEAL